MVIIFRDSVGHDICDIYIESPFPLVVLYNIYLSFSLYKREGHTHNGAELFGRLDPGVCV
jgi:hypothetical protein